MSKIDLKKDAVVFFSNEEYSIVRVASFSKIVIEHSISKDITTVNLDQLTSKPLTTVKKIYLDNYSDKEWNIAKKRYDIIKNIVFKQKTRKDIETIAKKNNVSPTTIYTWVKIYEQTEEISSLVPNTTQRGKSGSRLDKKVENIIEQVLEDLYLNKQRYGFRKIYSHIARECKKLNVEPPHENTIRNRIDAISPKLATKRRLGHKASQSKYNNFEGEFPEGNYPLEVIQIDHTPLDIIVVDKLHRQPIGRPYLTLAIDVYSRMITGFYISLQAPGYFNVSQCLFNSFMKKEVFLNEQKVQGEWNVFGIPRIIHVDNGADLVSSDMQRVCDEFGITLMKRPVARPQFGAHVERVLGRINKEVHNLAGTTFSNIQEKANYDSAKNAVFTIEELNHWITHYIVNIYHNEYHHGIEMTPNVKYEIGIFGDDTTAGTGVLPSIIENTEDIRTALLPTYFRTIQKDGISLNGITYYSDVLRHWIGITNDKKEKIKHKIKLDPLNIQKIFFYDPEIKEYFEVPYKKLYAPVMTLWDLYATKRYLKEQNISNYTEDDLFSAYDVLESIEKKAIDTHKKKKLRKSKPAKITTINSDKSQDIEPLSSQHYDSLFEDIEIFNVSNIKVEDEED